MFFLNLTKQKKTVKGARLCDFGLFRELIDGKYVASNSGDLGPLLTAFEVDDREKEGIRIFTLASDVFSFGVLMWEALSFGSLDSFSETDPKPEKCPSELWSIVEGCLKDVKTRSTITDVLARLTNVTSKIDGSINLVQGKREEPKKGPYKSQFPKKD